MSPVVRSPHARCSADRSHRHGLAIAAGHGWASTGWVGSGLALGGLAIWAAALSLDSRRPGT